jgi:hypothetical protein
VKFEPGPIITRVQAQQPLVAIGGPSKSGGS